MVSKWFLYQERGKLHCPKSNPHKPAETSRSSVRKLLPVTLWPTVTPTPLKLHPLTTRLPPDMEQYAFVDPHKNIKPVTSECFVKFKIFLKISKIEYKILVMLLLCCQENVSGLILIFSFMQIFKKRYINVVYIFIFKSTTLIPRIVCVKIFVWMNQIDVKTLFSFSMETILTIEYAKYIFKLCVHFVSMCLWFKKVTLLCLCDWKFKNGHRQTL